MRFRHESLALILVSLPALLWGCSSQQPRKAAVPPESIPPSTATNPHGGYYSKVSTDSQLPQLQTKAKELYARVAANPKDKDLKKQAAEASYQAGYAMMMADKLDRKEKYRGALRYYRQALKLDPSHVAAADNKAMIESIYKQLGRPVPQ